MNGLIIQPNLRLEGLSVDGEIVDPEYYIGKTFQEFYIHYLGCYLNSVTICSYYNVELERRIFIDSEQDFRQAIEYAVTWQRGYLQLETKKFPRATQFLNGVFYPLLPDPVAFIVCGMLCVSTFSYVLCFLLIFFGIWLGVARKRKVNLYKAHDRAIYRYCEETEQQAIQARLIINHF